MVTTFEQELDKHRHLAIGTFVIGDLNVHSKRLLKHSTGKLPEGTELERACRDMGLRQEVTEPTRRKNLLDLVPTDSCTTTTTTMAGVSDHCLVLAP